MSLAPEIAQILHQQQTDPSFTRPGSAPVSILQARALHDADAATFTPLHLRSTVGSMEEIAVPVMDNALPARIYRPAKNDTTATLVWFHGGGWVTGSLNTADIAARALCNMAGVTVLSVEYRMAPEHPWPRPYQDALQATMWAAAHLQLLGNTTTLLVGGDSAGGNLAATVALARPDLIKGQVLVYPVVALDEPQEAYPSRVSNGDGYYVEWKDISWAIERYVPHSADRSDPSVSPIRSTALAGAPPAIVVSVEYDPLRDEDRQYAQALKDAGAEATLLEFDGLVHGAFDMLGTSETAANAMVELASEVQRLARRIPPHGH